MNFFTMTQDQRHAHLVEKATQTVCALLVYMDEYGELKMCATSEFGHESMILDCISLVCCRAELFLEDHLDMDIPEKGGDQ